LRSTWSDPSSHLYSTNSILGVIEEHKHLDRICGTKDNAVESLEQNFIKENQKIYDKFVIKMMDGTEKVLYFDISSFFGKFKN
jgi:hypothetical protein